MGLQLNPERVSFSVSNYVKAAEAAAKAISRAAVKKLFGQPTKMMAGRKITASAANSKFKAVLHFFSTCFSAYARHSLGCISERAPRSTNVEFSNSGASIFSRMARVAAREAAFQEVQQT